MRGVEGPIGGATGPKERQKAIERQQQQQLKSLVTVSQVQSGFLVRVIATPSRNAALAERKIQ